MYFLVLESEGGGLRGRETVLRGEANIKRESRESEKKRDERRVRLELTLSGDPRCSWKMILVVFNDVAESYSQLVATC